MMLMMLTDVFRFGEVEKGCPADTNDARWWCRGRPDYGDDLAGAGSNFVWTEEGETSVDRWRG